MPYMWIAETDSAHYFEFNPSHFRISQFHIRFLNHVKLVWYSFGTLCELMYRAYEELQQSLVPRR